MYEFFTKNFGSYIIENTKEHLIYLIPGEKLACQFDWYGEQRAEAFNVLTNRPTQAAYIATGAPQSIYALESVIDELCQSFNQDPLYVRILNAAKKGTKSSYGPTFDDIGLKAVSYTHLRAHETP